MSLAIISHPRKRLLFSQDGNDGSSLPIEHEVDLLVINHCATQTSRTGLPSQVREVSFANYHSKFAEAVDFRTLCQAQLGMTFFHVVRHVVLRCESL
jgi:hypothetical protein